MIASNKILALLGTISGTKLIKPSKVIISESRDVSGFSGIDMNAFGKVVLSQGSPESLTISGSDNLVPLIKTTVRDGILHIERVEQFNVTSINKDTILTYTIVAQDLDTLVLSGLGEMQVEILTTPQLSITVSGGGQVQISQLTTDQLAVTLSGTGSVKLAGEAKQATIDLSGTGSVESPELKIQTAAVYHSGLGGATLWVTDRLSGDLSGTGGVSYYGNPQTDIKKSVLGSYKSLGDK